MLKILNLNRSRIIVLLIVILTAFILEISLQDKVEGKHVKEKESTDGHDESVPAKVISSSVKIGDDGIVLNWRTENEYNNLGFRVFQKIEKSGHELELTDHLISGKGYSTISHDYSFTISGFPNYQNLHLYIIKAYDFDKTAYTVKTIHVQGYLRLSRLD